MRKTLFKDILQDNVEERYFLPKERSDFLLKIASLPGKKRQRILKILKAYKKTRPRRLKKIESILLKDIKITVKEGQCIRNMHLTQNGILNTDVAFTITCTEIPHAAVIKDGELRVRRITPIEAERLQGYPEDHSLYFTDEKSLSGTTHQLRDNNHKGDAIRYKQIGNGVSSPVGKHFIEKVMPEGGSIFSAFSGINGTGLSLDHEKYKTVAFCEIDKHCREVLTSNHFETPIVKSITDVTTKNVDPFDMFLATFPCPSFSVAGKGGGLEDPRGNLVFEVFRVTEIFKPKYFLCENVPGLLYHDDGKTYQFIKDKFISMGYTVHEEIVSSVDFGLPQNRRRLFFYGIRNDQGQIDEVA